MFYFKHQIKQCITKCLTDCKKPGHNYIMRQWQLLYFETDKLRQVLRCQFISQFLLLQFIFCLQTINQLLWSCMSMHTCSREFAKTVSWNPSGLQAVSFFAASMAATCCFCLQICFTFRSKWSAGRVNSENSAQNKNRRSTWNGN